MYWPGFALVRSPVGANVVASVTTPGPLPAWFTAKIPNAVSTTVILNAALVCPFEVTVTVAAPLGTAEGITAPTCPAETYTGIA